ncbi:MAG TPA: protein kinase [Kofleriaceae bacterium]|nr:protein kinase [Kofleriaceae bacterium]
MGFAALRSGGGCIESSIMGPLDVLSARVDPLVGMMLGKDYRVIEPIGFGGMGVVYLVEHQTLRKRFAAKVLSVELAANFEAHARFTQEAHAASQLDHENIVNISDFGETADRRPFFVMELLRGQTLDQRLAEGPMSLEEVVAVAVPVARALAHAHAEGIIHRDVKPENVFLVQRSQGRFGVKVVDFGIAKTPVNNRLTKMGETLGSPTFMSPEACRGEDVDHRADLYSFGVLLFLMLCGRVPFADDNLLKVLQMQVSEPLPSPCSINPALSPELGAVLERALAKDPDARYVSMADLLLALEAAVPPGSDRLLIETQAGGPSSFRIVTSTGQPAVRPSDSQPFARSASQPLPRPVSTPIPAVTSAGTPPALPTSRRRRRAWLLAVPAIAAIGLAGWLVVRHGDAPAAAGPRVASTAPEPVERRAPDPAPAAAAPAPASREAHIAPPVATIHLHLATTPAGAAVELAGKRLGATPLDVDLAREDAEAQLVISRAGFAPLQQPLDLRADRSLSLVLAPLGRPPRIVRRPAPVERAAPAAPGQGSGSAAAKGDPNLDIRMSR